MSVPGVVAILIAYAALVVAVVTIRPLTDGDRVQDRYNRATGTIEHRWPHAALVVWDDGTRTMHDPDHLRRHRS